MNLFTWIKKKKKISGHITNGISPIFEKIQVKNEKDRRFRKQLPGKTKERSIERNDCISGASLQLSGSSSTRKKRALEILDHITMILQSMLEIYKYQLNLFFFCVLELTLCACISVQATQRYTNSV